MRAQQILLAAWLGLSGLPGTGAEFRDYPGEPLLQGQPAAPKLASPAARRYRTQLRTQSAQGPNFNGQYRIAFWGCGSQCLEWAVVNLKDGAVWFAPTEYCAVPRQDAEGGTHWIDFHSHSRLLFLYGCQMTAETACPGADELRRMAYVWTGGTARHLETSCVPGQ